MFFQHCIFFHKLCPAKGIFLSNIGSKQVINFFYDPIKGAFFSRNGKGMLFEKNSSL